MVTAGAERRRMVVALPLGSEAVAAMLVALGEAGIEVSRLGRSADNDGAFSLTVTGSPHFRGQFWKVSVARSFRSRFFDAGSGLHWGDLVAVSNQN